MVTMPQPMNHTLTGFVPAIKSVESRHDVYRVEDH